MPIPSFIEKRSEKCELCNSADIHVAFTVPPKLEENEDHTIGLCLKCEEQLNTESLDVNHLRCLNESIWSELKAVKIVSYRLLRRLTEHDWAQDLLGMMYLDEPEQEWADAVSEVKLIHKDSNGNTLSEGDSVTLIQDLNVKGAGFTAKRGVAVRRIRLVHDNAEHIEGKIDGQQIVILTKYVKKSN